MAVGSKSTAQHRGLDDVLARVRRARGPRHSGPAGIGIEDRDQGEGGMQ